jgi:hypothetical protein
LLLWYPFFPSLFKLELEPALLMEDVLPPTLGRHFHTLIPRPPPLPLLPSGVTRSRQRGPDNSSCGCLGGSQEARVEESGPLVLPTSRVLSKSLDGERLAFFLPLRRRPCWVSEEDGEGEEDDAAAR